MQPPSNQTNVRFYHTRKLVLWQVAAEKMVLAAIRWRPAGRMARSRKNRLFRPVFQWHLPGLTGNDQRTANPKVFFM
jgi:hypothetical protein